MKSFAFLLVAAFSLISVQAQAVPNEQEIAAYRALVAQDLRLETTGYRLAKANAPFCELKQRNPGWVLHSYRQYPDREIAQAAFPFPTPVAVAAVVSGGPTDKAGIKVGEGIADLGGNIWWGGERIKHRPSSELVDGINKRVRSALLKDGPVRIELGSLSGPLSSHRKIQLDPPQICASNFVISAGRKADAGADGERVRIQCQTRRIRA